MFSEIWLWIKTSRLAHILMGVLVLSIVSLLLINEFFQSTFQSLYLSRISKQLKYEIVDGSSGLVAFGADGPYDQRLGYSALPELSNSANKNGFKIIKQARLAKQHVNLIKQGVFPIYHEKTQAGLEILNKDGDKFYSSLYPSYVFSDYSEIPELIIKSLLFIENRDLLDNRYPGRNPAIEWDRFGRALVDVGIKQLKSSHKAAGASTLATQIEKYRHSPGGRTDSGQEKIRQMISASLRAYMDGNDTSKARERIVYDYINSIPLSGIPNYGEVNGLGDGLKAWYGADLSYTVNQINFCNSTVTSECALSYKQVLSLFVAQRRPSYYLARRPDSLERLTNTYLKLLNNYGVISSELLEQASKQNLEIKKVKPYEPVGTFVERKAEDRIRTYLLSTLGVNQLYQLDRLDLSAQSVIDSKLQSKINATLSKLHDSSFAAAQGLNNQYLLSTNAALENIVYSFTLYERTAEGNLLRISTDNYNQPLDINRGVKLDLGSTAKLRTLVTYLEVVSEVYERYKAQDIEQLKKLESHRLDRIGSWVKDQIINNKATNLTDILQAAMQRVYSGSTSETFFTGSGVHTFANFKREDNFKSFTVQEAFRHSVNLPFIRLMRDIVNYFIYNPDFGLGKILEDKNDLRRKEYLARFADNEGSFFQRRFYRKYTKKDETEIIKVLLQNVRETPERYTAVLRALLPKYGQDKIGILLRLNLPLNQFTDKEVERLYRRYQYALSNLPDRGFIARLHPLEIWTAEYLIENPKATMNEVLAASKSARQEVYRWLFTTRHKNAQDTRIRIMLETQAFLEIHKYWKRVGYPFDSLVPSYATSIGSSADRPAALAELMGIIVSNGQRKPTIIVDHMLFGKGTPYETHFSLKPKRVRQILQPEVATVLQEALADIVQNGTARRIRDVFTDQQNIPIRVGGKTGTGDHRHDNYGPGGKLLSSRVVNRTATFVFYIGDKYFGTIVAYVSGSEAAKYKFTSALPVQILKIIAPQLNENLLVGLSGFEPPTSRTPSERATSLRHSPMG